MQKRKMFGFQFFICCCFLVFCITDAAKVCDAIDQCTCKTQDGKYISLWEIDQRLTVGDAGGRIGFSYNFRPCTSFSTGTQCQNVLGCQVTGKEASDSYAIAYKPKLVTTSYDILNKLHFNYHGKETRKMVITLVCDLTATTPKLDDLYEYPSFTYSSTLTTKCACPGACKYTPAPTPAQPTSSSGKLSAGSIICIALFALVIVYLVVGIVISKFALHKEGSEIIPNKSFWKDFPVLVKDGMVYTVGKIKGNRSKYQEL